MMATAPRASDDPAHNHEHTPSTGDDVPADSARENGTDLPATTSEPSAERPWPLIAAAAACIVVAIVGALGPWFSYERISESNPDTWTTPGYQSSGFFIIVFAVIALVTLGAALFRDRGEPLSWVAFIGMALCTVIVISVWTDPPQQTIPAGGADIVGRLAWGPRVVIFAAPIGAMLLFFVAHRITTSDD